MQNHNVLANQNFNRQIGLHYNAQQSQGQQPAVPSHASASAPVANHPGRGTKSYAGVKRNERLANGPTTAQESAVRKAIQKSAAAQPTEQTRRATQARARQQAKDNFKMAVTVGLLLAHVSEVSAKVSGGGQWQGFGKGDAPKGAADDAGKVSKHLADSDTFVHYMQEGVISPEFSVEEAAKVINTLYGLSPADKKKTIAQVEVKKGRKGNQTLDHFISRLPQASIDAGALGQHDAVYETIFVNPKANTSDALLAEEQRGVFVHEMNHMAAQLFLWEGKFFAENMTPKQMADMDPDAQKQRAFMQRYYYCIATAHYLAKTQPDHPVLKQLYDNLPQLTKNRLTAAGEGIKDFTLAQLEWFSAYKKGLQDMYFVGEEAIGTGGMKWSEPNLSELGKSLFRLDLKAEVLDMLKNMPVKLGACRDRDIPFHVPTEVTQASNPDELDFAKVIEYETDKVYTAVFDRLSPAQKAEIERLSRDTTIWTEGVTFPQLMKHAYDATFTKTEADLHSELYDSLLTKAEKKRLLLTMEYGRSTGTYYPAVGKAPTMQQPHVARTNAYGQLLVSSDDPDRSLMGSVAYVQAVAAPEFNKLCKERHDQYYYSVACAAHAVSSNKGDAATKELIDKLKKNLPLHLLNQKDDKGRVLSLHEVLMRELERQTKIRAIDSYRDADGKPVGSTCGQFVASMTADSWTDAGRKILALFYDLSKYADVAKMLSGHTVVYPVNAKPGSDMKTEALHMPRDLPEKVDGKSPDISATPIVRGAADAMLKKFPAVGARIDQILGCSKTAGRAGGTGDSDCQPVADTEEMDGPQAQAPYAEPEPAAGGVPYAGLAGGVMGVAGVAALFGYLRKKHNDLVQARRADQASIEGQEMKGIERNPSIYKELSEDDRRYALLPTIHEESETMIDKAATSNAAKP